MEKSNSMNIYNLIILDESGSMSAIYDETLQAVNEAFSGIRKNQEEFPEQRHHVSIVTPSLMNWAMLAILLIAPCGIEMH